MTQVPGSRAFIDAALDRLYPQEKDYRYGLKPDADGTEPPLAEVVVYRASTPVPHWHYVTYGLTELQKKVSSDPTLSGFGVEYTLRLVDSSEQPPTWPIELLRYLAKRVWETRQPFDPAHSMNLPTAMLEQVSAGVEALAFFEDDQLRTLETPSGRITFVTVVPLMANEYSLIGSWDAFKVATEIRALQGDLLWRIGRKALLEGPRRDAIRKLVETEGSSQSVVFTELRCDEKQLVLDSVGVLVFDQFLRHRLAHGREAQVISGDRVTRLRPGNWSFTFGKTACELHVPDTEARRLADELAKAPDKSVIKRVGGVRLLVDRSRVSTP